MDKTDEQPFYDILSSIDGIYPKPIPEKSYQLWFDVLQRFDLADIRRGFTAHMNDTEAGQFLPKPADIIRHIQGGTGTRAQQAWTKVETAIRHVGPYPNIVFDDWIIHQVVVDMGGWIELNRVTDEELPFKANEFQKRYGGYILRPRNDYSRELTGIAAHQNKGKYAKEYVAIGSRDACRQVYLGGAEQRQQIIHRAAKLAHKVAGATNEN